MTVIGTLLGFLRDLTDICENAYQRIEVRNYRLSPLFLTLFAGPGLPCCVGHSSASDIHMPLLSDGRKFSD